MYYTKALSNDGKPLSNSGTLLALNKYLDLVFTQNVSSVHEVVQIFNLRARKMKCYAILVSLKRWSFRRLNELGKLSHLDQMIFTPVF